MATIYLARDLRHRRAVAVKVLHPELSAVLGPERFLKEIEVTANLQHAHILPLFDSGNAGGLLYYVMPYVEGESLRARLVRERQLPVEDALRLAREVADALDYAHRHGVVHRDVKPENILLQNGHALVADFGIALAVEQAGGARMTQTGLSLGTPQYMAPEQATGERGIDARADVYALGAVLYEMLAGVPPFVGPTAQAIFARVITEEPKALIALRRSVPVHVDAAVLRALEKLPADRFPTPAAFADALAGPSHTATVPARPARRMMLKRLTMVLGIGTLMAALAAAWALGRASTGRSSERRQVRFTIELDSTVLRFGEPAISPDGETLVYAAEGPNEARLYARRVDDIAARPLAGTENAEAAFFSPDGEWVAFYSNGALRKVRLDGGAPMLVTDVPRPAVFAGATWGSDDAIYYALAPRGTLHRVAATGGRPSRVAVADSSVRLVRPRSLPGGRALLVTVMEDYGALGSVAVLDLASGDLRVIDRGLGARYAAGTLVYGGARGELFRQPFDLRRLKPTAAAEQLASGLTPANVWGHFAFDVAESGTLIYTIGARRYSRGTTRLSVVDSAGREQRVVKARTPLIPRFAPDGHRVLHAADSPGLETSDVWVSDLEAGSAQRVTNDGEDNNDPVWSPDGTQIAYSQRAAGGKDIWIRSLDGGQGRLLLHRPGEQWPSDWVDKGSALLFTEFTPEGDIDVWMQPMDGGAARPLLNTLAQEAGAVVSPNGRWVAYMSDETGRNEVYVQSYPSLGRKQLVSASGGGVNPMWRHDGRALYYWKANQLMVAHVRPGGGDASMVFDKPTLLVRAPYVDGEHANYDVSPDGRRLVVVTVETSASRIVVAVHALGPKGARRRSSR
jgi:serine/threonine-protein kinase